LFKDNHLFVLTLRTSSIGDPISTPQTQPGQAPQEDFKPSGGSEALFSMCLYRVIEEDRRMVESWKGAAEGILTFVGLQTTSHTSAYNLEIVDWPLLCRGRSIACVHPGYSAELTGHVSLSDPTEPFSPPTSSVWVDGLWVSSLVCSPHIARTRMPRSSRCAWNTHIPRSALVRASALCGSRVGACSGYCTCPPGDTCKRGRR